MGRAVLVVAALAAVVLACWWLLRFPAPVPPPTTATPASGPARSPSTVSATPVPGPEEDPPAEASVSAPPVPVARGIALIGWVKDGGRFPVAGATVSLAGGAAESIARTGDDGAFRIAGVPRPPGAEGASVAVLARDAAGRAGVGQTWVTEESPAEVRIAPIDLEQALPLAVRVRHDGAGISGARVRLAWNFSGVLEALAGEDGVARFDAVPAGPWAVHARSEDFSLVGRADLLLGPDLAQPVEVAMEGARTVEVRAEERGAGRPVEGATFSIHLIRRSPGMITVVDPGPLPPVAPTDADGRTRIGGTRPDDELQIVQAMAPGFHRAGGRDSTRVRPGDREVVVQFAAAREIRFPVEEGEAPVPADGAVIALEKEAGFVTAPVGVEARMEGTTLVVTGAQAYYFMAQAVAPDGSRARLWADDKGTPPPPVRFRPPRTVEVVAKRADGTPVSGVVFAIRNQGNNPLAPPFRSGDDGVARATALLGEKAEVYLLGEGPGYEGPFGGRPVGTVDIGKSDARLEVVVPTLRAFRARVTLDGKPGLPARYSLLVNGTGVPDAEEDPAAGEIRGRAPVDPASPIFTATLNAAGWLPARAEVDPIPEGDPVECALALVPGGTLRVPVALPPDGACLLHLHVQDPTGMWTLYLAPDARMYGGLAPGPDGVLVLEGLAPGRYRVFESTVGVSTVTAEVRRGETASLPPLDLARFAWAAGRVVLPEGVAPTGVEVLVEGPGLERSPAAGSLDRRAARVGATGEFRVRIPGDRPVTVRPCHATLVPAAGGGTAEVTGSRDDLVLRLVEGRVARVRLSPVPPVSRGMPGQPGPRVLLFRGEPTGEPASEHSALRDGDGLAFGGWEPGTWTVWIDAGPGFAPAVVRGAVLGEEGADLGTVNIVEGSRVRLRVLVKEGQAVPRIALGATREEAPRYTRWTNTNGEAEGILAGLGPGRFRISARAVMGGPPGGKASLGEVHEVDGIHDLDLSLDLR
jgi:hypothetical protein